MLTEFDFKNAYVSGSHPQMWCRFITQRFSYNIEALASSQYKFKKTKNCNKDRTINEHLRLKEKIWDKAQESKELNIAQECLLIWLIQDLLFL
jgi:hypothetical protein